MESGHTGDFDTLVEGRYNAVDFVRWRFEDFLFTVEIQFIGTVLFIAEWMEAMLWGAHWKRCVEVVLTGSQLEHCTYIVTVLGLSCLGALVFHRSRTRLSLKSKRRFGHQVRKRWSG